MCGFGIYFAFFLLNKQHILAVRYLLAWDDATQLSARHFNVNTVYILRHVQSIEVFQCIEMI